MQQLAQRCETCFFYMNSIKLSDMQKINDVFETRGVHICLVSSECDKSRLSCNLEEVFSKPDGLPLEDYKIVVESGGKRHEMHFELVRRAISVSCKTGSPFRL